MITFFAKILVVYLALAFAFFALKKENEKDAE
jgi:hypothetical protein